jgi:putative flippase GtrA
MAYKIARMAIYALLMNSSEAVRDNIAFIAGICLFTILNYLGQRFIVFKKHKKS